MKKKDYFNASPDKMLLNFLSSKGISNFYILVLYLIRFFQIISLVVDIDNPVFVNQLSTSKIATFLKFTAVDLPTILINTSNTSVLNILSIFMPTLVLFLSITFVWSNYLINKKKEKLVKRNNPWIILLMNLLLFYIIVLPIPFFNQFFQIIFCNFGTINTTQGYSECLNRILNSIVVHFYWFKFNCCYFYLIFVC